MKPHVKKVQMEGKACWGICMDRFNSRGAPAKPVVIARDLRLACAVYERKMQGKGWVRLQ